MGRIEKTVFISYRRTNFPWALAIFQDLTQHGYDVFFDFLGISAGDFETVIIENIKARAHFVVLLTPSALERCGEPGDWLRREIETALEVKRNIIPLMLENFDFGAPGIGSQLTGELEALKSYNGLRVPPEYFLEAMGRLRDRYLSVALDAVLHPTSQLAKEAAVDQKTAATSAPPVQEEELTAGEWFERGYNAVELGEIEEGIRCYSEAIRLKPDYAEAFNNRGNAHRKKGDLQGALQDLEEAVIRAPDAVTLYNRGLVHLEKGSAQEALMDFNEAIRLKPDYADAFNDLGIASDHLGDFEGAIHNFDEAIRLKPNDARAHGNRGIARYRKGDLFGAVEDYNNAIRLDPDYAESFYHRGLARQAKGDLDGALDDYNEATRLKPDYANALYNRAGLRKTQGDEQGAATDYQKYLDLGGGLRDGDQAKVEKMIRDLENSSAN